VALTKISATSRVTSSCDQGCSDMPEIKIVRVGDVERDLISYLSLTLASSLDTPCVSSSYHLDPEFAYDLKRRQYHSTKLLSELCEVDCATGDRVLGITSVDLFIPILTFVFGEAQLDGRVALMSAHRLRPQFYGLTADQTLFYSRCEKEAAHELGHTYGLRHCLNYECVMRVSNSVEQVDLKPADYCSACASILKLEPKKVIETFGK
jgi:archaemetzincin